MKTQPAIFVEVANSSLHNFEMIDKASSHSSEELRDDVKTAIRPSSRSSESEDHAD